MNSIFELEDFNPFSQIGGKLKENLSTYTGQFDWNDTFFFSHLKFRMPLNYIKNSQRNTVFESLNFKIKIKNYFNLIIYHLKTIYYNILCLDLAK